MTYILFDIGGSKTRITQSKDLVSFDEPIIYRTPSDYEEMLATFKEQVRVIAKDSSVQAVVGGVPASFDKRHTKLVSGGPNVTGWLNKPIIEDFSRICEADAYIENDTMMGGLAQAHFGPAKGQKIVVYVTISTGLGGARIVDGKIDANTNGFEPGWQIIDLGRTVCGDCSDRGYLHDYVSGKAFRDRYGLEAHEVADKTAWDFAAYHLACGLNNIAVMWSPDSIVLGGSMISNEGGIDFKLVDSNLGDIMTRFVKPELLEADFGDVMGLWGAMAYAKVYDV